METRDITHALHVEEQAGNEMLDEERILDSEIISDVIDRFVHHERNRAILKRRLIDGIYYEPLAEEFKLSVRQVKNIVYKYEPLIFDKANKKE